MDKYIDNNQREVVSKLVSMYFVSSSANQHQQLLFWQKMSLNAFNMYAGFVRIFTQESLG